jgi:pimeloyl-ACP methyl ester carboxylesterase
MPSTPPPPARMVTIPDCGHGPALNLPSQQSLVADFLG